MPKFSPFAGIIYDPDTAGAEMADLIAPPYDVVDDSDADALEARSPYNVIRLELPRDEGTTDRYANAAAVFAEWREKGILTTDEPVFYAYRMGYYDDAGRPRQTTGVLGALELQEPGTGDILPHEHTTPKAKSDRLQLLEATHANMSPIWGLSPAVGLSGLCELTSPPLARATDADGVHHRLWRIEQPAAIQAIGELVSSDQVIIADGHHRFETAYAFSQTPNAPAGASAVLALIVELSEEQLLVRAIHRLLSGLPNSVDLPNAFADFFDITPTDPIDESITTRMQDAESLALYSPEGTWLLKPKQSTIDAADQDLDSSRLDVALAAFPEHELTYQHGWDLVAKAVNTGAANAGVLLRPATVEQIARTGRDRVRMPPKTTFFWPKPRTGLVIRSLD